MGAFDSIKLAARALKSATTSVLIDGATAPSAGQVLTAQSGTAANWQSVTSLGLLSTKAGVVTIGSFSGTPLKYTVTFSAAFADTDYTVTLDVESSGTRNFAPAYESKLAGSFVINLGTNNPAGISSVSWQAIKSGEE